MQLLRKNHKYNHKNKSQNNVVDKTPTSNSIKLPTQIYGIMDICVWSYKTKMTALAE
jgi:hypothetical protein